MNAPSLWVAVRHVAASVPVIERAHGSNRWDIPPSQNERNMKHITSSSTLRLHSLYGVADSIGVDNIFVIFIFFSVLRFDLSAAENHFISLCWRSEKKSIERARNCKVILPEKYVLHVVSPYAFCLCAHSICICICIFFFHFQSDPLRFLSRLTWSRHRSK